MKNVMKKTLICKFSYIAFKFFFARFMPPEEILPTGFFVPICRKIMFTYTFRNLDSFDEGFELSFLNNENGAGRWIPLWFFSAAETSNRTTHNINLGSVTDDEVLTLRGYDINFTVSENLSETYIKLCGPGVFNNQTDKGLFNWRFRLLQTVANNSMNSVDEDVIYIYNVSIVVNDTQELFQDYFSAEGRVKVSILCIKMAIEL